MVASWLFTHPADVKQHQLDVSEHLMVWVQDFFSLLSVFSFHQVPEGSTCQFSCCMLHYIHQLEACCLVLSTSCAVDKLPAARANQNSQLEGQKTKTMN